MRPIEEHQMGSICGTCQQHERITQSIWSRIERTTSKEELMWI